MENMRGRGRGKRGRGRGARGGRGKRSVGHKEDIPPDDVEEEVHHRAVTPDESHSAPQVPQPLDMEADISQLEPPTFSTLNRGPLEPMVRLQWDHPVNLLGEKVLNPLIHCCDICLRPVLIYGRMIPCKHVFCLACAQQNRDKCPRCSDKVTRIEHTGLGTVFMCTHGGTRYGNTGCRRTYLSQRDLQAHINHRHVQAPVGVMNQIPAQGNKGPNKPPERMPAPSNASPYYEPPKVKMFNETEPPLSYPPPPRPNDAPPGVPPIVRPPPPRPSNLITVPIQEPPHDPYFTGFNAPPPLAPLSHIPPHAMHGPIPPPHGPPPPFYPQAPPEISTFPRAQFDYPPPNPWPGNPPPYYN